MPTFQSLGLSDALVAELARLHIHTPSDIQTQAYATLSAHKNAWLSAPTGSGKTLAYLLPLLNQLDVVATDLQVMILAPTQELAVQIHDSIRQLDATGKLAIRSQLLIGNASAKRQKEKLKKKPHIIVGSCGRMLELANSGKLKLHKCQAVCIDEADNLLAEDHIEDLEALLKKMPRDRQLIFASATVKSDTFRNAEFIGKSVQWISGQAIASDTEIEHVYIESSFHRKIDTLGKLLRHLQPECALIFTHRNVTAEEVDGGLEKYDLSHTVLHGDMSKFDRQMAMKQFRKGTARVLIASDIAARGLDIKGLTHIINFDLPSQSDDYLHRAGRTGRMGAVGTAISIVTDQELRLIQRYERDLCITINMLKPIT
ncbi:DEAD/DEAH box helicase [Coraliomargarita sp. SDUM461004]|uniref:DEAD/DEAH box helicase n=1 Tax=Thalassobacterium sedimentorum TaxID=3041258 RepID=A0ABU1AEP1_9BACT|nr:DEAD/DEAH box helicase [Coraliomargarita sp. SDUM461004]MDQ8193124.1 DEAD/DEAH box helicase [Coraliomargarita sp. SDUM461004]